MVDVEFVAAEEPDQGEVEVVSEVDGEAAGGGDGGEDGDASGDAFLGDFEAAATADEDDAVVEGEFAFQ